MTKFNGFSDAAKLYAANEAIVNEIYKRLKSDVRSFWESVAEEMGSRVAPLQVEPDKLSDAAPYTYLHLKEGAETLASVWVLRDDAKLIRDSTVLVGFGISREAKDTAALAAGLKAQDLITGAGTVRRTQRPSVATLFQADLKLACDGREPIEVFADVTTPVLQRLAEIARS